MASRRSPFVSALFTLTRAGLRQSTRIGKAATRQGLKSGGELAKAGGRLLSGLATPTAAPVPLLGGRWFEGRGGLGPLALRRYRLFVPTGASARAPLPLLLLLHGCGQDTAAFAALTRCAAVARARGFAVLLPEQAREANPQRCWNWFGSEARVGLEMQILMALVEHVVATHPRVAGPLFALGLSAGGSMAMSLALRYPERFQAVASHSGSAPNCARTPLQAGQAMSGWRGPDAAAIEAKLRGRPLPPLLLIHGDRDGVVAFENARAAASLWRAVLPVHLPLQESSVELQRARRRGFTRSDWKLARKPYVRLLCIHGLTHAWSGGAAGQAFSDPSGPDALRLAWQFFSSTPEQGRPKAI